MFKLKNFKTLFISMLITIMLVLCVTPIVNAADVSPRIPGNHKLVYGISDFNYYITDTVLNHEMSDTWISLINDAAYSWEVTGYGWNPLYAHRTYDFYDSNMDIYLDTRSVEGSIMGNVIYFTGVSPNKVEVHPEFSDWNFTEVTMFVTMYDWNDYNRMQRYIAHFFRKNVRTC